VKTNKILLRELRAELRYWQMQATTEVRWLRMSRARAKEIGAKMRDLQPKPVTPLRPADWRPSGFIESAEQEKLL